MKSTSLTVIALLLAATTIKAKVTTIECPEKEKKWEEGDTLEQVVGVPVLNEERPEIEEDEEVGVEEEEVMPPTTSKEVSETVKPEMEMKPKVHDLIWERKTHTIGKMDCPTKQP